MTTYLALLRGINVGGNNTVSMKELKKLFESLGFYHVKTYINSGNVIFSSRKVPSEQTIEAALKKTFGFSLRIVIRDAKHIEDIVKKVPTDWTNDASQKTDVMFLWDSHDSKKTLASLNFDSTYISSLYVKGAIIYHLAKKHYNASKINTIIGTDVYTHMTARNINTVRTLHKLMNPFSDFSAPAQRALAGAKIVSLHDFSSWKKSDIAALHGIGPRVLSDIEKMMKKEKIQFV